MTDDRPRMAKLPPHLLTGDPCKVLAVLYAWRDFDGVIHEDNVGDVLSATLGLEPLYVRGFADRWEGRPASMPGHPDYAAGFADGAWREMLVTAYPERGGRGDANAP
jgi:hypothetical protein